MCAICIDFLKQLITVDEARNILSEAQSTIGAKHLEEVNDMLNKRNKHD